jgi:glyoxylase-like metal-dependent hydrolase (beta-lactamase superfamily II)
LVIGHCPEGLMIHEVLPVGPLQCNCSILGDETTREAIVIDPGDEVERILAVLAAHDLRVRYIVNTHAHFDHVGNCCELKQATGAEIWLHKGDLPIYETAPRQAAAFADYGVKPIHLAPVDRYLADADGLQVGRIAAEAIHTPGHTPGSLSLHVPGADRHMLFAGDTLFRDSIGRTDLPGGDMHQILRSIRDRLLCLDDQTEVWPGHGPMTTIGRERRRNPFLRDL